jgi:hypothetical protein
MATKKQRRRREKLHRHEYVWEDSEGNELESPAVRRDGRKPKEARAVQTSRGRQVQPPSWSRTLKRGLVFAPLMLLVVILVGGEMTLAQQVFQTVFLLLVFLPFSYFMDAMLWRSYQKRAAKSGKS